MPQIYKRVSLKCALNVKVTLYYRGCNVFVIVLNYLVVPPCSKCYTIVQDPFKQNEVPPNKTENITQKKIQHALKTKWKAAVRRHAISGASFFPVSSQGTGTGLDTLRERKRECKLTTSVKTYSPGHLGLQLNVDTPVIPMYSMCTV